ncbi:hypothetical protein [uncultured Algibacter sp.]|uniref:hypothetical protein n=1 Tax=uncultured Algibacter sp. TaxID=298659 RepID=UPI00262957D2|nr:hypothetical protein [uncultured Algibacter sp.]
MKKIIYSLMILGAVFTGCNPMEDIYNDLDSQERAGIDFIKAEETYTFTSEDYALYEKELDSVEYFMTQDLADQVIPDFLADKYPVWGEGSLVNVTYDLYDETLLEVMSTTETLSNLNEVDGYLGTNYETALNGTFVELTYNADILSYTLSDDDFETIGNALSAAYPEATESAIRFQNFDRRSDRDAYWSDEMLLEGFTELLGGEYNLGQVVAITFAIYDGGTNFSETFTVQYNGYGFTKLDVEASGTTATEYTLTGTDYDMIATDLGATYPGPAENLGRFGSFDVRPTSDNYWSEDMILEGLNIILPMATEGDVYAVTYAVYNGSVATETVTLLYTAGAYVPNATIVEVTTVVAKNDGDWQFPYVFTKKDFDSFGFRFPNFSSSNIYILDIFLEGLFPYAQAGDVAMVQYDYFSGSTNAKYGHSIFDGDKWTLTPDIIETSFQYGFEDGVWVPDNTINYTLLSADVAFISDAFIDIYPGPADNVGFFGSFDRRDGSDNYWSDDMLIEVANVLLDSIDPGALEGQKYVLNMVVYTGATGIESISVIKTGGVWVAN